MSEPTTSAERGRRKVMTGQVVSTAMQKTAVVTIERLVKHAVYGKYVRKSTKLHAHDANNECNEGDIVTVRESRPYSKTKTWVLVSIDERAPAQDAASV